MLRHFLVFSLFWALILARSPPKKIQENSAKKSADKYGPFMPPDAKGNELFDMMIVNDIVKKACKLLNNGNDGGCSHFTASTRPKLSGYRKRGVAPNNIVYAVFFQPDELDEELVVQVEIAELPKEKLQYIRLQKANENYKV